MVTMQKYLIDLQAKGVTVPPPEFKLSNLIDLYQQIETLEAESKLFAGIIKQLNDDNKETERQAERLADALRKIDEFKSDTSIFEVAREALEAYRLAQ